MNIEWCGRDELMPRAMRLIERTEIVLDIGAGIRRTEWAPGDLHILCEPFDEYVGVLQDRYRLDPRKVIVQSGGAEFLATLPDALVDTVLLVDVIEHVEKAAGVDLLRACERVARRQVVVFTPLGFMEQDYRPGDQDGWGLSGGLWQRHLSGWTPEDFDASWQILACREFHTINGKGEPFDPPFGAFWAIRKTVANERAPDHLLAAMMLSYAHLAQDFVELKQSHTALVEGRVLPFRRAMALSRYTANRARRLLSHVFTKPQP